MDLRILSLLFAVLFAGCATTPRVGAYAFTREEVRDGCDSGYYRNFSGPGIPYVVTSSIEQMTIWLYDHDGYFWGEQNCDVDGQLFTCTSPNGDGYEYGVFLGTIFSATQFSLVYTNHYDVVYDKTCSTLWASTLKWINPLPDNVAERYDEEIER